MRLLFYDIEVFSDDVIIVFKNPDKSIFKIMHNEFSELRSIVNNYVLVGYNNHFYDDKIITKLLSGASVKDIKRLNDQIIAGTATLKVSRQVESLDCFQQIDVSVPGLKKIEGNLGKAIVESAVDFDVDRKLSDSELDEVIRYCAYDVDSTIEVYNKRQGYFETKQMLIDMLDKKGCERWNTTTLAANILLKNPSVKWAYHRVPEDILSLVDESIIDLWETKEGKGKITINEFNNEITFGFGGLHGEHESIKRAKNVKLLDVTSMYPNIIIVLDALNPATGKYREILNERVRIKHIDKVKSDALKLILNSTYGLLNNKYSTVCNPKAALSVCMYGQVALYQLCKYISPFVEIINVNTDGVAFKPYSDDYKAAIPIWEEEFKLKLEEDSYDQFIQKDVNNYIAVVDGKVVKAIGADVKRYFKNADFTNNNARILDIAIVDKLVHGKDIIDTLMENLDKSILYQYILKAGGTYQGTVDKDFNKYNKVNRVFATKGDGICLQKHRNDGGLVQFADAPTSMYLWNDDVEELKGFDEIVDINHYYKIIMKKLERWGI